MVKKRNIVVDIGNTRVKVAEFNGELLLREENCSDIEEYIKALSGQEITWLIAAVGMKSEEVRKLWRNETYTILDTDTPLPLKIHYETPTTLGMDRVACAVGAAAEYPQKHVLIIDMGTCIKYDLVTKDGSFQGGVISPGLHMRMKALHEFTLHLPDISAEWTQLITSIPGKSTKSCLYLGSFEGLVHEMNGFIEGYRKDYENLTVIITGGDVGNFESRLKAPIFADPNLLVKGLNRILIYNESY